VDNLSDEKGVEDEQQKQRQERKERLVGVLVADLVRTQRAEPRPRARQLRRIRLRIDHFHHLPQCDKPSTVQFSTCWFLCDFG